MCLCKHTVPEAASSWKAALSGPAGRSGLQTPRPPAGPPWCRTWGAVAVQLRLRARPVQRRLAFIRSLCFS